MKPIPTIDLNADLGEGGSQDAELIALASSANIACGGHAGDEESMRSAIMSALAAGVVIGAHPGYEDRENFGRRAMHLSPAAVVELVSRQITRLAEIAAELGAQIHHVKPHGALYNQADRDPALAAAVAEGVARTLPGCQFYVPPGGALATAGEKMGLRVRAEGFVDRRYQEDGALAPRGEPDAVIEDPAAAIAQALQIACKGQVKTVADTWLPMPAETLCVHGDSPRSVEILHAVRQALANAGFKLHAP